jgi:enamine deaminase RidA (YjgF/YER057c/UK114 family)
MVRLGAYLKDMSSFPALNELLERRLTPPYPARTTIPTALEGFDVEMDAVFWIPE